MTEEHARDSYQEFCARTHRPPRSTSAVPLPDGSWLFVEVDEPQPGRYEGVAVRSDGGVVPFYGALGKVLRDWLTGLGAPMTVERFLGSTAHGHYQRFNGGVAVWEGVEDIGYPLLESLSPLQRQLCAVAFFDLRGFTGWSKDTNPEEIQLAIRAFEDALHEGFRIGPPWERLFLKGTGDGAMVVSQADWFQGTNLHQPMSELARGHATSFLTACEQTVLAGRSRLAHHRFPLAIGCGIALGALDRIFIFGRFDFIGAVANEAAKLQQHAWNEICVTREFAGALNLDGRTLDAEWELATKGWRLRPPR